MPQFYNIQYIPRDKYMNFSVFQFVTETRPSAELFL